MEYNKIEQNKPEVPKEENVTKEALKPVVTKAVKKQKKGLVERLVLGVIGPDGLPAIGRYVGSEIIVPAIKNIIADGVTSAINMAMFGENRPNTTRSTGGYSRTPSTPQTNYASRYVSSSANQTPAQQAYSRPVAARATRALVEDYIISDRNEALMVLENLTHSAETYGNVAVADYYDLIGEESSFTDNQYGWTAGDLIRAQILPTRGGYIIKMPPVIVL